MTGKTGSCRYMAPEVWSGKAYDHRADVFSFGILAYELLARTRAYEDLFMTMEQVAAAVHRSEDFRPKMPKAWPEKLVALIRAAWAEKPIDRLSFREIA